MDDMHHIIISVSDVEARIGYYPRYLEVVASSKDRIMIKSVGNRSTGGSFEFPIPAGKSDWFCSHLRTVAGKIDETIVKITDDGIDIGMEIWTGFHSICRNPKGDTE